MPGKFQEDWGFHSRLSWQSAPVDHTPKVIVAGWPAWKVGDLEKRHKKRPKHQFALPKRL
jgi:hypothetical protein